mmetsp:Transcript_10058/g.27080  ORF Transcript_10058/g.27080 Transcript_10058/m.27080 type:complete len:211 (+) Transcript_10058:628-1260(+)
MCCLQGLQLLGMLVRRVAQEFLHVLDTLLDGRMVVQQILCVLAMGIPEALHLLCMLVCGVSEQLLDVFHALGHGGVPRAGGLQVLQALEMPRVAILEKFDVFGRGFVHASRIPDKSLQNLQPIVERRVRLGHLPGREPHGRFERADLAAECSEVADEGRGLLADQPQLGLVKLHLLLVQRLDLPLPIRLHALRLRDLAAARASHQHADHV